MFEFVTARELYDIMSNGSELEKDGYEFVEIEGWVRTNRNNGSIGFIELNDGTYFRNIQIVYSKNDNNNFDELASISNGFAVCVMGKLVSSQGSKQLFEIIAKDIEVLAKCDVDYPLQKKSHSFEFLREYLHLRPRTNTFRAVFRVRSVLSMAIHEFFQDQGFIYVHGPIITSNDAEGAGEAFSVTTRKDGDYEKDFFGKKASLTVSAQLHAEAFAQTFRDVYTFGPTFRAEKSNTSRHAAEFWMIEPEIAFADLEDDMNLIEDMIKYCIKYVLENASAEMDFFNTMIDKAILERLNNVLSSQFKKLSYTEAIKVLEKAVVSGHKFENNDIYWGMDLNSEHEKYLCETYAAGPLFVTDYPKDLKSFYMKQNDDGKTVAACDLLVPGIGELVGASQREDVYEKLKTRMDELQMSTEGLEWYLDLRRFGGVKTAGFGLGFERMIMFITGMSNIRDVIPFPRTVKNCDF